MTPDKKDLLIKNTINNMNGVTKNVCYRHAVHCYKADKDYGTRIAKGLNLDLNKVIELSKVDNKKLNEVTSDYSMK